MLYCFYCDMLYSNETIALYSGYLCVFEFCVRVYANINYLSAFFFSQ